MFNLLTRAYRLTKKRILNDYTTEFKAWKLEYKQSVQKHGREFWEIQTEVESNWIENYNQKLRLASSRRETKNREAVIKISKSTIELSKLKEERAKKIESNLKLKADNYANDLFRKKLLIDTMNFETTRWITLDNCKELITENVLIPNNLDNSQYYTKLREQSYIAGLGKIVGKNDYYNNRRETKLKNHFLSHYFVEVRSLIRHLSHSPIQTLFEDFEAAKSRLFDYPEKISTIKSKYQELALAWKNRENENMEIYISRTYKTLDLIIKLIQNWNEYINIAKMDDLEIDSIYCNLPDAKKIVQFTENESEDWTRDFQRANPETSESDEDLQLNKEDTDSGPTPPESIEIQSEDLISDFDMYQGENNSKKPDKNKTLDDIITQMLQEINSSKELFKDQEKFNKIDLKPSDNKIYSPIVSLQATLDKILKIEDDKLDLQYKWKKEQTIKMIEVLNNTKIDEAHMLLKVYLHHRYDPPVFE
jgi:hypothetical protein